MHKGLGLSKDYFIKSKIGSGGFGEVFLVQDQYGDKYALKKIDLIQNNIDLNLLRRQIQIMQYLRNKRLDQDTKSQGSILKSTQGSSLKEGSKYIVDIYDWQETQQYIKIIIQYCDGKDLRKDVTNYQLGVYPFDEAVRIISDVIRGLEVIHAHGIVHRDIKMENILIKNIKICQQNFRKIYKIGDFGISKDVSKKKAKTVLGTRQYMSPELFYGKQYSYQVDMWALGVLFCYMLNSSYPFRINPMNDDFKDLGRNLERESKNFSYRKFVSKSKLKLQKNCTEEMQDLFSKIFNPDPSKRITFNKIRQHPVFRDNFSQKSTDHLRQLYENKKLKSISGIKESAPIKITQIFPKNSTEYYKQIQTLKNKNSQLLFLFQIQQQIKIIATFLTELDKIPICYNIVKWHIIRKSKFIHELQNHKIITRFPELKLKQFISKESKQYNQFVQSIKQQMSSAFSELQQLTSLSESWVQQISKISPSFQKHFQQHLDRKSFHKMNFDGDFMASYKQSSNNLYKKVFNLYKKQRNQKYMYILCITSICHYFNHLFKVPQQTRSIFLQYFHGARDIQKIIDFSQFKDWLKRAPSQVLTQIVHRIRDTFTK